MIKISQQDRDLEDVHELHEKLPSSMQVVDYLRTLNIRTYKKTSLMQNGGRKPCFRPDGSLLVVTKSA